MKFTLTAGGNNINGKIGNIKNPYSAVNLQMIEIRYYQGCASSTPTDTTSREFSNGFTLPINPGVINTVSFSVSNSIVGDFAFNNRATFTYTPGTKMSALGGYVDIRTPNWYSSKLTPE